MRKPFATVQGVVDWRLCLGCGACAPACPAGKIALVDVLDEGIRPRVDDESCGACSRCLEVCPAHENDHSALLGQPGLIEALKPAFGPVLEVWEGHAGDPEIRRKGSSGGVITALSLFALEHEAMGGVLHVAGDPDDPVRNRTRLSRTRDELLEATGSRYSPAAVCDGLDRVEASPEPCVVVGQPSEVTALRKSARQRPALAARVGLAISFFCAGSPATRGTLELLRDQGVDPHHVAGLRYRGLGWPGSFGYWRRDDERFVALLSYAASWGFLQRFRPFAVNLTPDGSGEDADVSCGDPWYRPVAPGEPGSSLILVRTPRGREIVRRAREAGYLQIEPADPRKALVSQANLIRKRGAIWGRVLALRLFGLPAPRLRGFSLLHNWLRLPLLEQAQSTLGTMRRIVQRRLWRPLPAATRRH